VGQKSDKSDKLNKLYLKDLKDLTFPSAVELNLLAVRRLKKKLLEIFELNFLIILSVATPR
jgi:hypothetical protein